MRWFVVVACIAVVLSACGPSVSSGDSDQYYSGYDGVQVRISPGSTGDKYYYYPPSVRNPIPSDDYGLIFNLELQNKGSADSL
ncbi:MAG: hypothetical protein ABIH41_05410, partial [Nanoarchaeota archaeon]